MNASNAALPERGSLLYFSAVCFVAAIGGLLFGYDTAVVSGAIGPVTVQFDLDQQPWMIGWVVASALVGCLMGASAGGWLSDRFGRKQILLLSAVLFLVTGVGCATAPNPHIIALARWIGGLGVGVASVVAPLYIAEISPPQLRGRMVSFYQLAIAGGVLVAYLVNAQVDSMHRSAAEMQQAGALFSDMYRWMIVEEHWRGMFFALVFPAIAFLVMLFGVPESPRFLVKRGNESRALATLARVAGRSEGQRELAEIREAIAGESEALGEELWHPGTRRALGLAIFLACAGQLTGINAIVYFGPMIFAKAGLANDPTLTSIFAAVGLAQDPTLICQVILGAVNVVFTFLAIWKVDTMGRRPLLAWGTLGVFIALVMMGVFFATGAVDTSEVSEGSQGAAATQAASASGYLLVFVISGFLACFAFSLGPLPWVFMSEVFPTRIRGRAMSIATLCLWLTNTVVCETFPVLHKSPSFGPALTFWLYALLITPVFIFVWKFMPETKGRSLEELEKAFAENRA